MTKYVINSGAVNRYESKAKLFFAEVVEGLGDSPKLLIAMFAQPRENWETGFAKLSERIQEMAPDGVTLEFELAQPDTFESQLARNDAVYIPGGDDHLVILWLGKFDLEKAWEGKVVATNSASSNALSTHFWTCDWRKNLDGLGILPFKFLSHYKSDFGNDDPYRGPVDWASARQSLEAYGDTSLPLHALEEGDYLVLVK